MSALPLTPCQEKLWRYIGSCDRSPTYQEMADALGFKCKSGRLHEIVKALERKGMVKRTPRRARSLVAIDPRLELSSLTTEALMAELDGRGIGIVMLPLHGRIS